MASELRSKNLFLNVSEFDSGATVMRSKPPVLFIELTQNCNLGCKMCRVGKRYEPALDMTEKIFQKLEVELFPTAVIIDLRGWGESTILRSFRDKVRRAASSGANLRLVTNALGIDLDVWSLLMSIDANVVVSVDAATRETMSSLGRGSFKALLRSLEHAMTARAAAAGRGRIMFNTVLTSVNAREIPGIIRLAAQFDIERVTVFPVVVSRRNPLHLEHVKESIPAILEAGREIARDLGVELRLGASPHEMLVLPDGLPNRCSHPWEYCYIDYLGNVGYCDHLIGNRALVVGDLNLSSFEDIWNGEEMVKLRELHIQAKAAQPGNLETKYKHCAWCYYRRYVDFEDHTRPSEVHRCVSSVTKETFDFDKGIVVPPVDFMHHSNRV